MTYSGRRSTPPSARGVTFLSTNVTVETQPDGRHSLLKFPQTTLWA
jgi:hypothetical protein